MPGREGSAGAAPERARRPEEGEYAPYYARYVSQVPEGVRAEPHHLAKYEWLAGTAEVTGWKRFFVK